MKSRILRSLATLTGTVALGALAGQALAQSRDLTVVSWGGTFQDAQKEVYFKPYVAAGNKMTEDSWDGGIGVLRTKIKGGNNNWDVVQVEAPDVEVGCDEGLFEKIDYSKIGGADRYLSNTMSPCAIGSVITALVVAYDADKLKVGPKDWADFFDNKKFPGKRAIRNDAKFNLEAALLADGVAHKDVYRLMRTPEGVDRAFKKLDTIKNDLVFWKAGAQPPQMLAAGDVVMSTAYNGRISAANVKDKKNFKSVWKDAPTTMDSWVILKGTPQKANAEKFLEFVGRPELQANLPKYIRYGVPAKAATALIDKELMPDMPTNPANAKVAFAEDVRFWIDNGDKLTERWIQWTGSK